MDAVLIGAALVFSSTIIGIKLLPTTVLHHRHLGELMIALLLFQDLTRHHCAWY
jgi:Kef-type K+ transport system membrane component KefB